jgi:hypothetical protein
MDPYANTYDEDELWQAFIELPLHIDPATGGATYHPVTGPVSLPPVERGVSMSLSREHGTPEYLAGYDAPVSFAPFAPAGTSLTAQEVHTDGVSPVPAASESSLFPGSFSDHSKRLSSTPATISHNLASEQYHSGKESYNPSGFQLVLTDYKGLTFRNSTIQTVEDARKSKRRAQNRAAQKTFKQRKKRREKELVEEIDAAETRNWELEAENKRLEEELDRKKEERCCTLSAAKGPGEGGGKGKQRQRSSEG